MLSITSKETSKTHWMNFGLFRSIRAVFYQLHDEKQGYKLTFFPQEQAGPLKQNVWWSQPKSKGPRIRRKIKLISTALPSINFALLIIEVRDPQNLYFSNYLPY